MEGKKKRMSFTPGDFLTFDKLTNKLLLYEMPDQVKLSIMANRIMASYRFITGQLLTLTIFTFTKMPLLSKGNKLTQTNLHDLAKVFKLYSPPLAVNDHY